LNARGFDLSPLSALAPRRSGFARRRPPPKSLGGRSLSSRPDRFALARSLSSPKSLRGSLGARRPLSRSLFNLLRSLSGGSFQARDLLRCAHQRRKCSAIYRRGGPVDGEARPPVFGLPTGPPWPNRRPIRHLSSSCPPFLTRIAVRPLIRHRALCACVAERRRKKTEKGWAGGERKWAVEAHVEGEEREKMGCFIFCFFVFLFGLFIIRKKGKIHK